MVVLEQGAYVKEKDFSHDELRVDFLNLIANDPKLQPSTFRTKASKPAKVEQRYNHGRLVGGGSVHFTANYWRLHPDDFRERSIFGEIPGSSFADWPVTYNELGAVLHQSGVGTRDLRTRRRESVRGAAFEAISAAAAAGQVIRSLV